MSLLPTKQEMDWVNWFQGYTENSKGWICPKCQRVWSPDVEECWYCNDKDPLDELGEFVRNEFRKHLDSLENNETTGNN